MHLQLGGFDPSVALGGAREDVPPWRAHPLMQRHSDSAARPAFMDATGVASQCHAPTEQSARCDFAVDWNPRQRPAAHIGAMATGCTLGHQRPDRSVHDGSSRVDDHAGTLRTSPQPLCAEWMTMEGPTTHRRSGRQSHSGQQMFPQTLKHIKKNTEWTTNRKQLCIKYI